MSWLLLILKESNSFGGNVSFCRARDLGAIRITIRIYTVVLSEDNCTSRFLYPHTHQPVKQLPNTTSIYCRIRIYLHCYSVV